MNEEEQKQPLRVRIGSALSTLALVVAVVLCLTVIVQVTTNGYVQIGGFSLFRVITGSMEPEIPVGSLLICQKTPIEDIQVGDIVCFRSLNPKMLGSVITHRVVAIDHTPDGLPLLETKGDANLTADVEFVSQANLIGRVNYSTKDKNLVASVVDLMTDKIGFLVLILFPTLLIAGFILRSCMMSMRRDIEAALEEEKRIREEEQQVYTPDEYAQMRDRIKQELLEELKNGAAQNKQQGENSSETE